MTPDLRADVAVVGGGVIGVSSAHALAERGVHVLLVERDEICSGSSHGNAGWIFPSHSTPLPVPGAVRQGLRWLFDPESPFYVQPRASLDLTRWLWRFRAACTPHAARRTFELNRELSLASLAHYAELAERLSFGFEQRGLLLACESVEGLRGLEREVAELRALGGDAELLDGEQLRQREPALAKGLPGGVHFPADAHITPGDFVRGLAADLESRGVGIARHTEVLHIEAGSRGVVARTTRGELRCDELVLAAGAWTPALARAPGVRVPVEAAKGYSVTRAKPAGFGSAPVMLAEAKVAATPMGDQLRFAGTLELAGLDLSVNLRRLQAIERAARRFLPELPETPHVETWRGLRPLTPDDLPILGRIRAAPRLVLATGHGMSGIAQGPISGQLVAQLVCDQKPGLDMAPFSPQRFGA